jgi:hypothetical protein
MQGRRRVRAASGRGRLQPLHRRWQASRSQRIDPALGLPRPHHRLRDVAAAAGISDRRADELLRAVRAEDQQP